MGTDFNLTQIHEGDYLVEEALDLASRNSNTLLNSILEKAICEAHDSILAALECVAHGNNQEALQALESALEHGAILRAMEYYSPGEINRREAIKREEWELMQAGE